MSWAAELFPQHRHTSGAHAVLDAADQARASLVSQLTRDRDQAICDELDHIDQTEQHEWGQHW